MLQKSRTEEHNPRYSYECILYSSVPTNIWRYIRWPYIHRRDRRLIDEFTLTNLLVFPVVLCQDFRELNVPYASYRTNLNIYENRCAVTKWNKIQPQGYVDMLLSKQKACLNSISNQIT
jgi:hypothetical protein